MMGEPASAIAPSDGGSGGRSAGATRAATRALIRSLWNRHFVPRPLRDADVWAEQELHLPTGETSEPGRLSFTRAPYGRLPLQLLSPRSLTRDVAFMAPAQVVKTVIGLATAAFFVVEHPCTIWFVFPSEENAKAFKTDRWDPIVAATPALRAVIPHQKSREGANTQKRTLFAGGSLKFLGANVPANLRSKPVRVLILEEYDALSRQLKDEGTAAGIAEARTRSFRRPKIYRDSTPTVAGGSAIVEALEQAECVFDWHVPCPHCGVRQVLRWEQVRYQKPARLAQGRRSVVPDVTVECVSCHAAIAERDKFRMKAEGEWIPRWDHGRRTVGFDGSTLAMLAEKTWGEMAVKYEAGLSDEEQMREFRNLDLGLPFEEDTTTPSTDALLERREPYPAGTVPAGARLLVAGVDTQSSGDGWLRVGIYAYGRNMECWAIERRTIIGATTDHRAGAWLELRQRFLDASWPCAGGGTIPIRAIAIDSGHLPDVVYAFAQESAKPVYGKRGTQVTRDRTVLAIKGAALQHVAYAVASTADAEKRRGGIRVIRLNVGMLRIALYRRLRILALSPGEVASGDQPPRGLIHFPDDEAFDAAYFAELTNAELKKKQSGGFTQLYWDKPKGVRHEDGDCFVYALGAAIVCGAERHRDADWVHLEARLPPGLVQPPTRVAMVEAPREAPRPPVPAPTAAPPVGAAVRRRRFSNTWLGG